ncbi:MAG: serine/threonine-protein kinase [Acidobacteriota bacterium]
MKPSPSPMDPERWQRIETLFAEAVDLEAHAVAPFLDERCADDAELRIEIERLLDADRSTSAAIESAVVEGIRLFNDQQKEREEGRRIGPYRIVEKLGEGGMGEVFLALRDDHEYDQKVAIKVVRPGMGSPGILERFRRERQILANLDHPNIARLFDGGTTDDGLPYFVMEYIEGEPIHRYCDDHGLSITERLELFTTVCSAVYHAHQNLVVHRDLKPSNILVTGDGTVKLLDFGIAKLLAPEATATQVDLTELEKPLTLAYASPEQVRGDLISTSSDVYSLGVVLYLLLTGRRPIQGLHVPRREVERRILEDEPPLPSQVIRRPKPVDGAEPLAAEEIARRRGGRPEALTRRLAGDLDNVSLKALAKDRSRRYSSVELLARDLRNHLEGQPVLAREATLAYRASKFVRRHRLGVTVAAAFLLVIVVSGIALFQSSQRARQERDKALRVAGFMAEMFEISNPETSLGETITARELLDRGARKLRRELGEQPEIRAALLDSVGFVYYKLGLYEQAGPLVAEALGVRSAELPPDHPDVAESLNHMAAVRWAQGSYDDALDLFRRSLAAYERSYGEDDPHVAGALNDLAEALRGSGGYDEARVHLERSLKIYRDAYGDDRQEVAETLSNLALLLEEQGDPEAARPLIERALEIDRRVFSGPHPVVAQDFHNLALIEEVLADYESAAGHYGQALEMRRQVLGDDHPSTLETVNNLAVVLFFQGEYRRAAERFREALDTSRNLLGPQHPDVAAMANNLAVALLKLGAETYGEVIELLREALAIRIDVLGEEHKEVALTRDNLANALLTVGDYEGAEPLYQRALEQRLEIFGEEHEDVARSYSNLSLLRFVQGRHREAVATQRRSLALYEKIFGEEHPKTLVALAGLGQRLGAEGASEAAMTALRRAADLQRESLGDEHPELAKTLTYLGEILTDAGRLDEAEGLLREALAVRQAKLPSGHWRVAETASVLGSCLSMAGRYDEAEPLLRSSYEELKRERGAGNVNTRKARRRLAELYRATGRSAAAQVFAASPEIVSRS